ncbi:hypothetical protein F53441_9380 [Fusarium austroafricanum]|uniref:Amine oxidase n=1 Tax=Fusarium austroafricanum TaxID=2364996 RepID=A0A8H4KBQ3_9HYPO|nr:hypothetical protein F53441_9380 [Fusarium austroafricanum]
MASLSVSKDSGYDGGLDPIKAEVEVQVKELAELTVDEMDDWPKPNGTFFKEQAERMRIHLCCRLCGVVDVPAHFVLCSGCGGGHMPAHRPCLLNNPNHKPDSDEPPSYGDPCKEIDFQQWIFISWLLDTRLLGKDKTTLHVDDLWSTWLGLSEDQGGPYPQLCIYPQLEMLVNKVVQRPPFQYPSLISFVGDTGSGKSTLIRAMIESLAPGHEYQVPVQGAADDRYESTSSDVHLFADPKTQSSEVPRFFIDCEGFHGSDQSVSRKILSEARRAKRNTQTKLNGGLSDPPPDPISQHQSSAQNRINLQWGEIWGPAEGLKGVGRKQLGQVSPDTRSNVVNIVYPRLLYAFSDVVCFVTNNSRQAQDILGRMFDWAKDGHERTHNQRVRPGLIIVLNKMPMDTHDSIPSTDRETRKLLRSFEASTRFQELQRKWRVRGRIIWTAEELIRCYYEDFRVISIPQFTPSSPVIVQSIAIQIKAFYGEILSMSEKIRGKRKSFNLDFDTSSLSAYLRRSAEALGKDYQNSLDFHQLSDGDVAPPRRFSEHLAQLMARMAKLWHFDKIDQIEGEREMVLQMTPYIAACIMAQIDPKVGQKQQQKRKDALVDEARCGLEQFRNRSWRCEQQDQHGQRRCRNYFESHSKGHQFDILSENSDSPDASVENLVVGTYKSSYDPSGFTENLWEELSKIHDRTHAIQRLASYAKTGNVNSVSTQRTCLACLSNTPTNMLPCKPQQHGICEDCIRRYNPGVGEASAIRMNSCPLGCSLTTTPWTIRVKPRTAGARILALDGGGVRGIVELSLLAEIEKEVGFGIRLQDLFDLVIGTSTGGLVALGVFEKKWPLNEAIDQFSNLAKDAFALRTVLAIPGFFDIAKPFCSFRYKSSGINKALQAAFGDDHLFGQAKDDKQPGDQVKVGVVTCLDGQKHPCLLANYSRNPIEKLRDGREAYDCLQRADEQDEDFSDLGSTLFKPYIHEATRRTYVDGATVRNNPVRLAYEESTRIWKSSNPPDIILSIGTGIWVDEDTCEYVETPVSKLTHLIPSGMRKKIETGIEMVHAILDCNREWTDFNGPLRGRMKRNCHRLNVGFYKEPAGLDAVDELVNLRESVKIHFNENRRGLKSDYVQDQQLSPKEHVAAIAQRLISSLFYLSTSLADTVKGGRIRTTLHCRLPPGSNGAGALISEFKAPSFRMREVNNSGEPVVSPVQFLSADSFDKTTMSVEVELDISPGLHESLRIIPIIANLITMPRSQEGFLWTKSHTEHGLETQAVVPSSTRIDNTYDSIVIGAGFAGLVAARDLAAKGLNVLIIEARDRIGGRTWTARAFGEDFEMGGTWVHWNQPHLYSELTRYDLHHNLKTSNGSLNAESTYWKKSPYSREVLSQEAQNEAMAAAERIARKVFSIDGLTSQELMPYPHDPPRTSALWSKYDHLSLQDRLDTITDETDEDKAVFQATTNTFGASPSHAIGFTDALRWYALGNHTLEHLLPQLGLYKLGKGGMTSFARAIFDDFSGAALFGAEITNISQTPTKAIVTTKDGRSISAGRIICTIPLRKAYEEGHINKGSKIHFKLRSITPSWYYHAMPPAPFGFALTDHNGTKEQKDGTYCIGFGLTGHLKNVENSEEVIRLFNENIEPNNEVEGYLSHDWVADPYAKGTWACWGPSSNTAYLRELQLPHGRVIFASGDTADGWRGFIDGALEQGKKAARVIVREHYKTEKARL